MALSTQPGQFEAAEANATIHLQDLIDQATGENCAGYAGYCRQSCLEEGIMSPQEFVDLAEQIGVQAYVEWFDVPSDDPGRRLRNYGPNMALAAAVAEIQFKVFPPEKLADRCDCYFGIGTAHALRRAACMARSQDECDALKTEIEGRKPGSSLDLGTDIQWKHRLWQEPLAVSEETKAAPLRKTITWGTEIAPLAPGRFVIVGDSLTSKAGGMSSHLKTVEYAGGVGKTTGAVLKELRNKKPAELRELFGGKKALVALGGNDIFNEVSLDKTLTNLVEIADIIVEAGGEPAYGIRIPYDYDALVQRKGAAKAEQMVAGHHALRESLLAMKGNVPVLDFADGAGRPDAQGRMVLDRSKAEVAGDALHLREGYREGAAYISHFFNLWDEGEGEANEGLS